MSQIKSILVILQASSVDDSMDLMIKNSINIGEWLNCELYFLCSEENEEIVKKLTSEYTSHLKHTTSVLILHSPILDEIEGIMDAAQKYNCEMILLHENKAFEECITRVHEIIERSCVPLLLLPKNFKFEGKFHNSLLVPLSGENRRSESLALSLRIAHQTGAYVDVLHVTDERLHIGEQNLEILGDQFHHEYRHTLDKIASEACPYSNPEERKQLRHFYRPKGPIVDEVQRILTESPGEILILEWKESLAQKYSLTIDILLKNMFYPIVIAKSFYEEKSILHVGKDFQCKS